jgi:hypothetical protein
MSKSRVEILGEGRITLDPVLKKHGFLFENGPAGKGSGGPYVSGFYSNGDRKLEFHYRYSLGLVRYHYKKTSVDHESYMHAVLGGKGGNRYPGFSESPSAQFSDLAYDLENFANSFLEGNFKEFSRFAQAAENRNKTPGIARLP